MVLGMEGPRVLVLEEEQGGIARALRGMVGSTGAFTVLGPVPDARSAAEPMAKQMADMAIVDIDRIDGRGLSTLSRLCDAVPRVRALGATADDGPDVAAAALAAGACGIVGRWSDGDTLVEAFRRVDRGEIVLPDAHLPSLVRRLNGDRVRQRAGVRMASLTPRELEVIALVAEGWSTNDIAAAMGITPLTVQSHVKNVLGKLGVHSKVEAVRLAWRCGALAVPAHV
jgi:DNA-binding NarL/FixJ family response regulator